MLTLLLVDSELELVPSSIQNHPSIRSDATKRGKKASKLILDANKHHNAMKALDGDWTRRGRPDMVHMFLLTALESTVNKKGDLTILIHTRNNELISVDPSTRLPRNFNRFLGLFEQLFEVGAVPRQGEPLITMVPNVQFLDLIDGLEGRRVALSPKGTGKLGGLFKHGLDEDVVCMIGGFPSGDYTTPVYENADECISLGSEMLTIWTVASEILVRYGIIKYDL